MAFELRAIRYHSKRNEELEKFISEELRYLDYDDTLEFYERVVPKTDHMGRALLGANDRYFLLTGLLRRKDMLHPWLFNRCREVEASPDGHIDLWPRYHGKAVALDALVPTPSGQKRHGDLCVGDTVFGIDGRPCKVIATTSVFHDEDCYRVEFKGGYSVIVSGNHLWSVDVHSCRRVSGGKREGRRTEILNTRQLMAECAAGSRYRFLPSVAACAPLQYPVRELPVAPYALGLWLGDGHTVAGTITSGSQDIGDFSRFLAEDGHSVRITARPKCFSITLDGPPVDENGEPTECLRGHDRTAVGAVYRNGCVECRRQNGRHINFGDEMGPIVHKSLHVRLREAGLLGNKHIPDLYQISSVDQRISLLQGLMDSDGHCDKAGGATFSNINEALACGVHRLAAGLGLKPTIRQHHSKVNGEPYLSWDVAFQLRSEEFSVFRLTRKQNRATSAKVRTSRRHTVLRVVPVQSEPCSCIQVDRLDGLYLLGDQFIATHNSSIITFAGIIQDILCDPEITTAIFSVTKPLAQAFLAQIKDELEGNDYLKQLYSDVLYQDPKKQSPTEGKPSKWGVARGFTVKRRGNPKEATLEAHGLIDGQPTSRHFDKHVYDDIVTQDHIEKEQIKKTTQRWEMADNLGTLQGVRKQIAGTLYHHADTHVQIIDRGSARPRIYTATVDGTLNGDPILLSVKRWEEIKRDQRSTVSAQMLLDPSAGTDATFRAIWLKTYDVVPEVLNVYIMCDPSKGSTNRSDRTAIAVIGIDVAGNKYLLDGVRHRMKLSDRYAFLVQLKEKWEKRRGVQLVKVGYERYGQLTDLEVIEEYQRRDNNVFPIEELNTPRQGKHSKSDRIERLEPDMRRGAFYLPGVVHNPEYGDQNGFSVWKPWTKDDQAGAEKSKKSGHSIGHILYEPMRGLSRAQKVREFYGDHLRIVKPIKRRDEDKNVYDLTRAFIEEMVQHPFAPHDDLIDAVSRIYDMEPIAPIAYESGVTDPIGGEDDFTPGMYGDGDVGSDGQHLDS